jgi:hypothetical protein
LLAWNKRQRPLLGELIIELLKNDGTTLLGLLKIDSAVNLTNKIMHTQTSGGKFMKHSG